MERLKRILLVSPDLMASSQLAGLARGRAEIETLRRLEDSPQGGPYDLVLVDLQGMPGDPATLVPRIREIAACHASGHASEPDGQDSHDEHDSPPPPARLVAFGPHVAKQRLKAARTAGADDVVSRGELLGGFAALVDRWCG